MTANKVDVAELRDEMLALVEARSSMYGLLSRLYEKEVDSDLLDEMCAMKMPVNTGNEQVDAAYKMLHAYLSERWERTEEDLRIDYARVFFGNGMNAYDAAYPFESVHTSTDRLMMQDARDEVMTLYRAEGFAKSDAWKDNEDHIALELAFEKILCDKCTEALKSNDFEAVRNTLVTQYNFLLDHLVNWAPMFVGAMGKFSETDFYQALACLTSGFLSEDRQFLEGLLVELGCEVDHG